MLSALPNEGVSILVANTGETLFSIRAPVPEQDSFSDGGQGPEKPLVGEAEAEEEIFSFPYPEEKGEISDLLFPPIEGITGKVYSAIKEGESSHNRGNVSDSFSYLSFSAIRPRVSETVKPEFISLVKQPSIAGSYAGLLAYANYAASNTNFSYISNEIYERPNTPARILYSRETKPLYEIEFPMILLERIYIPDASNNKQYERSSIQPILETYQNLIQKTTTTLNAKFYAREFSDQDNNPNLDLRIDYETSTLELNLTRKELAVESENIKLSENKPAVLPLAEYFSESREIFTPVTNPKLNAPTTPEYREEARTQYQAMEGAKQLLSSLGFDDSLLRDSFIAKLDTHDIDTAKNNAQLQERSDVKYKNDSNTKQEFELKYKLVTESQKANLVPLRFNLDLELPRDLTISQTISNRNLITSLGCKEKTSLEYKRPQDTKEGDLAVLGSDGPSLIEGFLSNNFNSQLMYDNINDRVSKERERRADSIAINSIATPYDRLDFALESSANQSGIYNWARTNLYHYSLFTLENGKTQSDYQNNNVLKNTLLPNTEYRTNTITRLDNLVRFSYDNGRISSLSRTAATSNNCDISWIDAELQLQEDAETALIDNSNYLEISPEQCLERAVEQEKELAKEESGIDVQAEVYDKNTADAKADVYKRTELKEGQETETAESEDSSISYVAAAVGLGLVATITAPVNLLIKEDDYKTGAKKEILEENKKKKIDDIKEDDGSKPCYSITPKLDELSQEEYKRLVDIQNEKEGKKCYGQTKTTELDNGIYELFKGELEFTVTQDETKQNKKISVRGNNRNKYGGIYETESNSLGYKLSKLFEDKNLVPYIKLDRDVKPFEQINTKEQLIFDYLIGPHMTLGEHHLRFFVKDENGNLINTDFNTLLNPGNYKVRSFLTQKDHNYKTQYRETLEEINRTRELENGRIAPNLYSLVDKEGNEVEGVFALLDGLFVTKEGVRGKSYSVGNALNPLEPITIKDGTLASQWYESNTNVGINHSYIRTNTTEKGEVKGKNTLFFENEDAYKQLRRRYPTVKEELFGTNLVRINLDRGEIESEPGYGVEGIESKVKGNYAYVEVVNIGGINFSGLRFKNLEEAHQILEAKGMMPKDPNSKYQCNGRLRPLYNFLHEKDKELTMGDKEIEKGYVFSNVKILKAEYKGKAAKEVLEHLFAKAEAQGNGMQREYRINQNTGKEELAGISSYDGDALRKLGKGARLELYINGVVSSLDTKINPGDKMSLAYVVSTKNI